MSEDPIKVDAKRRKKNPPAGQRPGPRYAWNSIFKGRLVWGGFQRDETEVPFSHRTYKPLMSATEWEFTPPHETQDVFLESYYWSQRRRGAHQPDPPAEYQEWKVATLQEAVDKLTGEIRKQHDFTRDEIRMTRKEILEAVWRSPAEYIQLLCEAAFVFCSFALLLRWVLKIDLVNPFFALFIMFSSTIYWFLAWLKKHALVKS